MKIKNIIYIVVLSFTLSAYAFAQNLTVRQIMAEPSIAGQRVSGEKLSPDGTKVIYLWNAEGKPQRDLYLVSTSGGSSQKILSYGDLPKPTRPPERENKLDYGVDVRDTFVRERENQLGNFEWSPDSQRLVFSHGGDIYIANLSNSPAQSSEKIASLWQAYRLAMIRRLDLVPNLLNAVKVAGVQEQKIYEDLGNTRNQLIKTLESNSLSSTDIENAISKNNELTRSLELLTSLSENYPALRSSETFMRYVDEITGVENRINVARLDYNESLPKPSLKRITYTQAPESGVRFLDNDRILYSQSGNIFVLNTKDASIIQLSRESNPQSFLSVFGGTTSKDGSMIAYTVTDSSKQRQLVVPNFLPEFVTGGGPRRGWTEQKLYINKTDGSRDASHEIKLPKPEGVSSFRRMVWASDNRSLIVDRLDKDTKRRQLFYVYNAGGKDEKTILVTEETDEKWQASLSVIFEPNPTNANQLFFGSERDGYNHLYLATLEFPQPETSATPEAETRPAGSVPNPTVKIEQLTTGKWQVEWARWSPEGRDILYASTVDGYTERTFSLYAGPLKTSLPVEVGIKGTIGGFQVSQDSYPTIIFEHSLWNQPGDIYAVKGCEGCSTPLTPVKLTNTVPEAFTKIKWTEPKFIEINSRDGKKIPAKIYLPPGHNPKAKTKYPMAIFVHGAGYLQNVINGWNNYYREFMFNDMLAKKGYVVLDIDYRGSAGYGRDWRTDVHDFLGGKDFDDHIDAIDHMVANYNVNQSKIGVYGGSYGGFMAGMLAMRATERIAAAAALRPVFDWKNYYAANPFYTAQRLGFPDKNPEAYKRSSPITYADKLERPLLILHGMADDNVHVQDSVQLIEKLIRLNKTQYFEAMLYPSENHGFVRPESWADEYERILALFDKHLK